MDCVGEPTFPLLPREGDVREHLRNLRSARPHSPFRTGREARRGALRAQLLMSGFTLLEIVVVLLIITIILGMVGVNLTRNRSDVLRDEAERLAVVLQNAQQQAILEGRPYGFTFTDRGYRFLRINDSGHLVSVETDELLAPHELPPAVTLAPETGSEAMTAAKTTDASKKRSDVIVFDPSGEFPAFTLVLSVGDFSWYVQGQSDGQVLSSPLPKAATG
jgi:general secretion pathway protein H